jgi:ABC-type polysaccharide/polyol phosphate transport system ATPase subunit
MIQCKNVSKKFLIPHERRNTLKNFFIHLFRPLRYDVFYALQDITFSLSAGEWIGIIGRNGSGKSTLLRLMAQIFLPDSGHLSIQGKIVPLLELGIGFHGELTAKQNIHLNGALLGIPPQKLQSVENEILRFADIESFKDTKIKNFSSGMTARLAFAIALQSEGDVFLFD